MLWNVGTDENGERLPHWAGGHSQHWPPKWWPTRPVLGTWNSFYDSVTENSYWKPPDAAGWLTVWADFILYHSSHFDNGEPGFWKCDPMRVRGRPVLSWEKCGKLGGRRHLNISNKRTSLVGLALRVPAVSAGPKQKLNKTKGTSFQDLKKRKLFDLTPNSKSTPGCQANRWRSAWLCFSAPSAWGPAPSGSCPRSTGHSQPRSCLHIWTTTDRKSHCFHRIRNVVLRFVQHTYPLTVDDQAIWLSLRNIWVIFKPMLAFPCQLGTPPCQPLLQLVDDFKGKQSNFHRSLSNV